MDIECVFWGVWHPGTGRCSLLGRDKLPIDTEWSFDLIGCSWLEDLLSPFPQTPPSKQTLGCHLIGQGSDFRSCPADFWEMQLANHVGIKWDFLGHCVREWCECKFLPWMYFLFFSPSNVESLIWLQIKWKGNFLILFKLRHALRSNYKCRIHFYLFFFF